MIARIRDIALIVMAVGFTLMSVVVIVVAISLYSPLRQTANALSETANAIQGVAESAQGAVSNVEAAMDNIRLATEAAAEAAEQLAREGLKLDGAELEKAISGN